MESGKYEGDDRKKYKTDNKESGLLPRPKLNENKEKVNSKKTKEISNEFPNFTALTEEERLAFFEILNAARKNVEDNKESFGSEPFENPQDEFLQYFNGMFFQKEGIKVSSHASSAYSSTYTVGEDSREQSFRNSALDLSENFDPEDLFLLDKTFKCDSSSTASLSIRQSGTEKENYPKCAKSICLSKKNSSCTEIETWDEHQTTLNKDQNKIVNFSLKNKKKSGKKKEPNQKSEKSSRLLESTANDDNWSEKTYAVSSENFDFEKVSNKKKKNEKNVKNEWGMPLKSTPKFDSLSAEEKKIFFNVLQEAHENVLQRNLQNESGVLPFESIIKNYRMEGSQIHNYNDVSIGSQKTLRFQKDDHSNIKVKVTVTSTDNQRLEKEREEENYYKIKVPEKKEESKEEPKKKEEESKEEPKKRDESEDSSSESCEEVNENPESELTDKEEMDRLYKAKKKVIESKIKLTMKELEEKKKLKEEDCDIDEKGKLIDAESKAKSAEAKGSEPKKPEAKPLPEKTSVKKKDSSEWVPTSETEKPTVKKQDQEKKLSDIQKGKKEEKDKDKDFEVKNVNYKEETPAYKTETKKEKEVVQVASVNIHEKTKNKMDEKSESDLNEKSWKIREENLSQSEKPKVSVYRNEMIEEHQNVENEEKVEVNGETQTEIKARDSRTSEKRSQKESDEIFVEPNIQNKKDLSESEMEFKLLSNKVVAVSREDQQPVRTNKLSEGRSSENQRYLSGNSRGIESKNLESKSDQLNENYEGGKSAKKMEIPQGTDFKCGKVVLVEDGVIEKIKELIEDLERNAKSEEDSLSNEYVQLLLDYISYLSRVLCSLVNSRDKGADTDITQVQTSLTSPNPHLKFQEKRKCKRKSKRAEGENLKDHSSDSAGSLDDKKTKLEEKTSSLFSTKSDAPSEEDESLWAPMFTKQKILPSTKIRLLQDLLKERAKFVEGSISEFKIVRLPEKDYMPAEKPILRLNLEDEDEGFVEKGTKFNFFKAFFKFCRCGKKESADENSILENLKGEAVAVDTSEQKAKNPASATINDSTMEVLKAAERKKIIQKYWKYN